MLAKDKKIQTFTGDNLDAIVETGEFDSVAVSFINNIIPYVENSSGTNATITAQAFLVTLTTLKSALCSRR